MLQTVQLQPVYGASGYSANFGTPYLTIHNAPTGNDAGTYRNAGQHTDPASFYHVVRGVILFAYTFQFEAIDVVSATIFFYLHYGVAPHSPITNDYLRFFDGTGMAFPSYAKFGPLGALVTPMASDTVLDNLDESQLQQAPLNADGLQLLRNSVPHSIPFAFRTRKEIDSIPPDMFPNGEHSDLVQIWTAYLEVTYNPTTVQTNPADLITNSSARLNGHLTSDGGQACEVCFEHWKSGFPHDQTPWVSSLESQDFHATVSGLTPATTYYFRALARNGKGTYYGSNRSFMTEAAPAGRAGSIAPRLVAERLI